MRVLFNQIFFIKKSKTKEKQATVYLRLTINGTRTEISTQRCCDPAIWNPDASRLNGRTPEVKEFNQFLNTVELRIYEIYKELTATGSQIKGEIIKAHFQGIPARPRMLVEIYDQHNKQFEGLVGKEYSNGTLKTFKTCKTTIEDFLMWKFEENDIDIQKLGFEFINDYEFFLKSEKNCSHNTAMGYIKKLKKIVRQCVAKNWLDKDPFMSFKVSIRETHRTYLLDEELQAIIDKKIEIKRLEIVRDIFVFSCYTGLAYCDVAKLSSLDLGTGIDGEKWIFTTRTKTETSTRIPLLPPALAIIEKYANEHEAINKGKLLPILSNQRMNSYLKELGDICGITKTLTFHCARHTFATTVTLTHGVPIETVGQMLGHRSLRTTQHYAKIIDKKVSQDMTALRTKFLAPQEQKKETGISR